MVDVTVQLIVDEPYQPQEDWRTLPKAVESAFMAAHAAGPVALSLVITSAEAVQALNQPFVGKDSPTDVLAFPTSDDPTATEPGEPLPYRVLKLVLSPPDRETLHQRIGGRFHGMLAQGFEAEVQRLLDRGDLAPDLPSLRAVGYRQMVSYLLGACDRPTMIERAITATRQYAKRQMTWLRAERGAVWLPEPAAEALGQALKMVETAVT